MRAARRVPIRPAAALAAILLGVCAAAGEAQAWLRRVAPFEVTSIETLRIAPLSPEGEDARGELPALLSTPPGWSPGDAAVVLLPEAYPGTPTHNRLVEALLAEGAVVLEIDPEAGRGLSSESTALPPPAPVAEMLADLLGAAAALRRQPGAGPIVLIGLGAAAAQVLPAAGPAARAHLPPGMPGYAAVLALGSDGEASFLAGTPPPASERWPARLPLLCDAVAWAVAGSEAAGERMRRMAGDCLAALLIAPVETLAVADPPLHQVADDAR